MATKQSVTTITLNAGADLSALQFTAVKLDTNGNIVSATDATAAIIGILQSKPVSGEAAEVDIMGISKAIAGGTIAAGDYLTATTGGKLITTTTDKHKSIGIAMSAAVLNDIFSLMVRPGLTLSV